MTARSPANPFERWDLDPAEGPAGITARLRDLLEDADPREQEALRRAWEELTVHPRRRIEAAIGTYPETRPPLGSPPRPHPAARPGADGPEGRLVVAPVAGCLGAPPPMPPSWPDLDRDPLLAERPPRNGGPA